jgi:hypothetical protein
MTEPTPPTQLSAVCCEELRRVINLTLWYALWCAEAAPPRPDPCPLAEDAVRVLSSE